MKFENNWESKTLENLEKDFWGAPEYDSHLVTTCHLLRKKPLNEFSVKNLRIMIGQNIGLEYLIPLALEKLRINILSEGDMYEGDLLKAVLTSEADFWKKDPNNWNLMNEIISKNQTFIQQESEQRNIDSKLFEAINEFRTHH